MIYYQMRIVVFQEFYKFNKEYPKMVLIYIKELYFQVYKHFRYNL